nr:MAG: polyprotein 1 [Picornavirales sp.]
MNSTLKMFDPVDDADSSHPQCINFTQDIISSQGGYEPRRDAPCYGQMPLWNEKYQRRSKYRRKKENAEKAECKSVSYSYICKPVNSGHIHNKIVYNKRSEKCNCKLRSVTEELEDNLILEPHFGIESILSSHVSLKLLAKYAKIKIPDKILREFEGLILLFATLSQQSTAPGVIGVSLTWAQGRMSESLTSILSKYIQELLGKPEPQSNDNPDWLECLRDTRSNWELCKSNRAFKQVSKLLGILVTVGMCDQAKLTFDVGQFNIFTPQMLERHVNAFDLFDALFETVIFFVEGAYLCYQEGSLKPLLINDRSAMELDKEYAQICAWFALVQNGNLARFTKMSDQEFETRMNRLATSLSALSQSLKGPEKKLVMDKFQKILTMQNNFITMKIASGVRHAPWAISLFGESSQGKTTLGDQLVDALLVSQALPVEKEFRCAFNASDKFMSSWTSDKLVMIFDDLSNDKPEFAERPPTRALIDVINNQMFYAPKAELEAKGKCFVEPWIVVATTNVKDLDARAYSKCPYSVQRRLISLTVKAKKQFQRIEDGMPCGIDSSKVREYYTVDGEYKPPMFDDIWTVTVEKAVNPGDLSRSADYKPVVWRNKKLVDISMAECIQWAIEDFDVHKKNQEALLSGMRLRAGKMVLCPHEGCKQLRGNCPDHPWIDESIKEEPIKEDSKVFSDDMSMETFRSLSKADEDDWRKWWENIRSDYYAMSKEVPVDDSNLVPSAHFGRETVLATTKLWHSSSLLQTRVDTLYDRADKEASQLIYEKGSKFLTDFEWIKIIPAPILNHEDAPTWIKWFYDGAIKRDYEWEVNRRRLTMFFLDFMFACLSYFHIKSCIYFCLFSYLYYLFSFRQLYEKMEAQFIEDLKERNMEVRPMVKKYRDMYSKYIMATCVGIGALYGAARAYRAYRDANPLETQGSLEPTTVKEVEERDSEKNVWTSVVKRDLPITSTSKRMSADQLDNCVRKALVYGTIPDPTGNGVMNCAFVTSNVIIVPNHYFDRFGSEFECVFRKSNPEATGGQFTTTLSKKASYRIPRSDIRLCYTPCGGSYKDLTEYFPVDTMPAVPFRVHWRKKDGEILTAKGMTRPAVARTTAGEFEGGYYRNLSIDTFGGMCGAMLVSETNGSVITGVHLGGIAGSQVGCYGTITQQNIRDALEALRKVEGVALTGSAGNFETIVLGVQILKQDPLHVKSPVNYMPENSQIEYLGTCIGRSVTKTSVKVTPISEHILDVCHVPNIYRGPKLHPDWYGWQACLSNMANPAKQYPHSLLDIAVRDYKEPLLEVFRNKKMQWCEACPLTDHENLCGIPGKKFIDAIKLNTSVGFPLSGPKRDHVIEVEPTEEWPCNRVLEEVMMDDIRRIEQLYVKGERGYPIAKACKKDEILASDKCRIFYGNALSLTFLIRKYYLPILRVLQMNPLKSECAVGINSHGPEWQKLHEYMTKFGTDRLFGGDYGKYDQKLPSQLIIASLRILIDLARECNYTETDLRVMEAMIGDIVYAYIAFNGDLIGLTAGTHISGNSLTVIINGICGSLNLRCYFYTMYPALSFEDRLKFQEWIAITTYGDDNMGSVHKDLDRFTIKGCSKFLKKYGQEYTMPDKESELADFLQPGELEFLKRTSVYHEALGRHVGALKDKSIYKSLHCFIRDKNSPDTEESACAQNIDGALREWFNHGPVKFEQQRKLMKEVAIRARITHICTGLDLSYGERVKEWFDNYMPDQNVTPET